MAAAAVAASRILGQEMYDIQLRGALALARGSIAEMQTREGKTLAAVLAVAWLARDRKGVHVMTATITWRVVMRAGGATPIDFLDSRRAMYSTA